MYKPVKAVAALPQELLIQYYLVKGEAYSRKKIILHYQQPATIDRLEAERFIISKSATGGGRGEPVFADGKWFFGLEYPASYTRHSDGNTPAGYARYYDKVGNYSFIDLEGRDVEPMAAKGMVRLMHFPGYAVAEGNNGHYIRSKTVVAGCAEEHLSAEQSFTQYLATMPYAGKIITITYSKTSGFESHLLVERRVAAPVAKEGKGQLWPVTNGSRRQTIQLF